MLIRMGMGLLLAFVTALPVWAADMEEAQALCDEAFDTMRKHSMNPVSAKDYAVAIYKLEKALEIIEKNGKLDSDLAVEASSAHFWGGKASDIHIIRELEKLRKSGNLPPRPARKRNATQGGEEGVGLAGLEGGDEAAKAFAQAQAYAEGHKDDDFKVALCWFQMAGEHPGTAYSLKAVEEARRAQDRFMAKVAMQKEKMPDTPAMKPVREGDELVSQGDLEKAILKYKQSLRTENTIIAQRRLGHTYFLRAQQIKDEILPQWQELQPRYVEAWKGAWVQRGGMKTFRNDFPPYAAAQRQFVKLKQQLDRAFSYYQDGRWAFESVLKLSEGRKDLDAAAHVALCYVAVPKERRQAKTRLGAFLRAYQPKNDAERMLYAYCKIELESIQAQK